MSIYRVATAYSYDSTISRLQQRQSELAEQQDLLSSGKRVRRVSDDPAAAALAERERARQQRVQADLRALEASRRSLELAESTLSDVTDLYQRAKELIVRGGDGALNANDRQSIAHQLEGIRERLLALANTKDANGQPLFMGLGVSNPDGNPFVEDTVTPPPPPPPPPPYPPWYGPDGRAVRWDGVSGQRSATADTLPMALDGLRIFGESPTSTEQGNDSIWETLDRAILALQNDTNVQANLTIANQQLQQRLDAVLTARGQLGDWLNRADQMQAAFQARNDYHVAQESELTDLDMLAAISRFQTLQLGYQAGLQAYAQVQRLSLFQYLA
jgi:flagellar hook-associated protein 3 FlgL